MKLQHDNHRSFFFILALFFLLSHLPASAERLKISEHPIIFSATATPPDRLPDYFYSLNPAVADLIEWGSKTQFWKEAESQIEDFPLPVAIWLAQPYFPSKSLSWWKRWSSKWFPPRMKSQVYHHEHSFEVGLFEDWSTGAQTRQHFTSSTPLILLHANNPAEFLTLWHEMSGLEIVYDKEMVDKVLNATDQPSEFDEYGFPVEIPKIKSPASLRIDSGLFIEDFMNQLAYEVGGIAWHDESSWIIAPTERNEYTIAKACRLLSQLGRSKYEHAQCEQGIALAHLGEVVIPEILAEYKTAKGHYFKALTDLLSKIDCEERNQVFLKILKDLLDHKELDFDEKHIVDQLIDTLSKAHCKEALPMIQKLAEQEDFKVTCKIPLNRYDLPLPESYPKSNIKFSESEKAKLENDNVKKALPILIATLDQCAASSDDIVTVERIEIGKDGSVEFSWDNNFHSWYLWIPDVTGERVIVRSAYSVFYADDSLNCGFYIGKVVFKNGRWLFVDWATKYWAIS